MDMSHTKKGEWNEENAFFGHEIAMHKYISMMK